MEDLQRIGEQTEEHVPTQDPVEESDQGQTAQASHPKNTNPEDNLTSLRLSKERAERERDEYAKKLQEYEAAKKTAEESKKKQQYRDPSDFAEYKDVMEVREELERTRKANEQIALEMKLRQSYPDIDSVITSENIERLNREEPELAQMIGETQNKYTQAAVAYKYIKRLLESSSSYQKEKEHISANASKPRSAMAVSKGTPLSQVNDFVENPAEYRKRLYKEMVNAAQSR